MQIQPAIDAADKAASMVPCVGLRERHKQQVVWLKEYRRQQGTNSAFESLKWTWAGHPVTQK